MSARPPRFGGPSSFPPGVRVVREGLSEEPVPVARHPGWSKRFPWLVQGITTRGGKVSPFDLALFGGSGPAGAPERPSRFARWASLTRLEGMERTVHGRQVHRSTVRVHREGGAGLQLVPDTDGHVTRHPGVLMAVTVADCVPVFVVGAARRTVGILHAGWRGTAAGILEEGLAVLADRFDVTPGDVDVHLGPAICGSCYEVGPEVHEALGLDLPDGPEPVDLRAVLARRAVAAGVDGERVTTSPWCTSCGDPPFFSHRGGDPERQAAFLGIRGS